MGRRWLIVHLPSLGSRVRVSVTSSGFLGERNGVWVGFPLTLRISEQVRKTWYFLTYVHFTSVPFKCRVKGDRHWEMRSARKEIYGNAKLISLLYMYNAFHLKDTTLELCLLDFEISISYVTIMPVAVYDGCGSVAFVYWLRLKQYL